MIQGESEWKYARVGHVTASRFGDVIALGAKGQPLKARADYLLELAIERLTGEPKEGPTTYAMRWGTDCEQFARTAYEVQTGACAREVGFIKHPRIEWVGASPDGLVGEDGGQEIKCPENSAIHLQTVLNGIPEHHIAQVQGCMWVTGRQWWDFCSYDPRMPEAMRLYVQRIPRDEAYIAALEQKTVAFLSELDALLDQIAKKVA